MENVVTSPVPSLEAYAAKMLVERFNRMMSHAPGVIEGTSPEPVHQMRVWARRTRTALDVYAMSQLVQNRSAIAEIDAEVKRAADALGELRDTDVMIEFLGKSSELLPAEQQSGVLALVHELKELRSKVQAQAIHAVERLNSQNLPGKLFNVYGVIVNSAQVPEQSTASLLSTSN